MVDLSGPGRRQRAEALLVDASVADELADLVHEARAAGRPVAVAVAGAAVVDGFDLVVDAAAADARKPSREFFAAACVALGQTPGRCLFIDPDDRSVRGARAAGLSAYRWSGPGDVAYLRAALGL